MMKTAPTGFGNCPLALVIAHIKNIGLFVCNIVDDDYVEQPYLCIIHELNKSRPERLVMKGTLNSRQFVASEGVTSALGLHYRVYPPLEAEGHTSRITRS